MLKNYILIALRTILKNRFISFVNIFGLSIGLACSMLILIYVFHEFSYDRFHVQADRIFRVGRQILSAEGEMREPISCGPLATILKQDYPEVKDVVRIKSAGKNIIRYGDNLFYEKNIYYSDPSVFTVFSFSFIEGNPNTALIKPYSIVITHEMSEKYFGKKNPLGKSLIFNSEHHYIVTGVIENIPETTHKKINMLCSISTLYSDNSEELSDWFRYNYSTYVLLHHKKDRQILENKFPALIKEHIAQDAKTSQGTLLFYLMPLKKIHLYSHLDGNSPGLISQVFYFSLLALFITLIACINFMNLSTARSSIRAKEIGMRKVLGANRFLLIKQFLIEALVLSFFAFCIALLLVQLFLPSFSNIIEEDLQQLTSSPNLLFGFFALTILLGLVAGSYPAFYLARFQPVHALKALRHKGAHKSHFRSFLVVFQFFLSAILICQTLLIQYQLDHLKNKDIGFHKKDIIVLPIQNVEVKNSLKTLKNELYKMPDIHSVTATSSLPGLGIPRQVKIPQGYTRNEMQLMDDINVDGAFIPALDISVVAGRNFSEMHTSDHQQAIIINELAARKFGWENPIGKTIQYSTGNDQFKSRIVIGLVRDFHLSSMHRVIEPLFISNGLNNFNHILVRVQPNTMQTSLKLVREKWKILFPNHPFKYTFLEEKYDTYFRNLENVIYVFTFFSIIAIILACLGIVALAAFMSEQKTKEIGIRKVLGESTIGIFVRLNKELLKYVVLAILFIVPFALLTKDMMSRFLPYMTNPSVYVYLKAILFVFCSALISVSYQALKSSQADPITALRYE